MDGDEAHRDQLHGGEVRRLGSEENGAVGTVDLAAIRTKQLTQRNSEGEWSSWHRGFSSDQNEAVGTKVAAARRTE
eukprot:74635-Pleurochrysis_carterae.AAC.1